MEKSEHRKGRNPEDIDGREYSSRRGPGFAITVTESPADYRWHHIDIGEEDGDGVVSNAAEQIRIELIRIRSEREAASLDAARIQRWEEGQE